MEERSVLLITVDCLRADHIGCYGYERPTTPEIDSFVKDKATLFQYAYSNCPGTRWALQSIHMGTYTQQIDGIGIPDTGQPLASYFKQKGYTTGAFVKNGFLTRDYNYDRGFDTFHGVSDLRSEQPLIKRTGNWISQQLESELVRDKILEPINKEFLSRRGSNDGYRPSVTDEEVCEIATEWIRSQQTAERPYFAWVHLMDAHTPYARWNNHLKALRGDLEVEHVVNPSDHIKTKEKPPKKVIDAYDAGIRSADEAIGTLLDTTTDDSIIAITGDHGEEFGRYNPFHSASIYSSMTQIPIIVRTPELQSGRVTEYPAQHIDIAPTLAYTTDNNPLSQWVGDPLQDTDRTYDSPVYFYLDTQYGVRTDEWKLIRHSSHESDEFYRIQHNGSETKDFADENPRIMMVLSDQLEEHREWLRSHKLGSTNTRLNDDKENLSEAVRENLEELGYLDS